MLPDAPDTAGEARGDTAGSDRASVAQILCDGKRVYCQMLEGHRGSDLQGIRRALKAPLTWWLCACQPGSRSRSRRSVEMSSGCRSRQPFAPRMTMAQKCSWSGVGSDSPCGWCTVVCAWVTESEDVLCAARKPCALPPAGSPCPAAGAAVSVVHHSSVPLAFRARVCLFLVWL